jgi:signal transduction histidine kinase
MSAELNDVLLQARLRTLIAHLHEAVLVENESRIIILVNEAFSSLFCGGIACELLIGQSCVNAAEEAKNLFVNPDDFIQRIEQLLASKQIAVGEELEMTNGTILERDYIAIWVDNIYRGHLWKYRDVTENKLLLRQKEQLIKELTEHNVLRGKLLSIVSHDLRSPYATLSNLLETLDNKKLPENIFNKVIAELKTTVNNTGYLLDNVLAWAKIQVESVTFQPVRFRLKNLVDKEFELIQDKAAEKNVVLQSKIPETFEIIADKAMVDIILRNLLMNAVKFTEHGSIEVHAKESTGNFIISISDSGVGLTTDQAKKLFSTETHYTDEGTRKEKGAGFGLLICKDLVEKHNGKIWVESQPGMGSTFSFSLLKSAGPAII